MSDPNEKFQEGWIKGKSFLYGMIRQWFNEREEKMSKEFREYLEGLQG